MEINIFIRILFGSCIILNSDCSRDSDVGITVERFSRDIIEIIGSGDMKRLNRVILPENLNYFKNNGRYGDVEIYIESLSNTIPELTNGKIVVLHTSIAGKEEIFTSYGNKMFYDQIPERPEDTVLISVNYKIGEGVSRTLVIFASKRNGKYYVLIPDIHVLWGG